MKERKKEKEKRTRDQESALGRRDSCWSTANDHLPVKAREVPFHLGRVTCIFDPRVLLFGSSESSSQPHLGFISSATCIMIVVNCPFRVARPLAHVGAHPVVSRFFNSTNGTKLGTIGRSGPQVSLAGIITSRMFTAQLEVHPIRNMRIKYQTIAVYPSVSCVEDRQRWRAFESDLTI